MSKVDTKMSHEILARAYALSKPSETRELYDEWALSYDSDMADTSQDYVGPAVATAHVLSSLNVTSIPPSVEFLDAGCGTGLVGVCLAKAGAKTIDGLDLSEGMLGVARRTGAYRNLATADLSGPIQVPNGSYGVVVCVGTLTQGHVGPEAMDELVRVTRSGGFVVATVLDAIWKPQGYEDEVIRLEREGKVRLVSAEIEDYRKGAGVRARMVVLAVL